MKVTDRVEAVALSLIKGMTADVARHLDAHFDCLHDFFASNKSEAVQRTDGTKLFEDILDQRQDALRRAEAEVEYAGKHKIKTISFFDEDYPFRLRECYDAPLVLFQLGDADLSAARMLATVGTRRISPYGAFYSNKLIDDLVDEVGEVTIVSGLAAGVDSECHKAALRNHQSTVAVLAHGFGTIYPAQNRGLALQIIADGGALVTQYLHDESPFRSNFLERNRIIAGLSDATLVIESAHKGGAMNTAARAVDYARQVLVVPGRLNDDTYTGCNDLIRRHVGALVTSASDIADECHWISEKERKRPKQLDLFNDLDDNCKALINFLKTQSDAVSMDAILSALDIPMNDVVNSISTLTLDNKIIEFPGNRYQLAK